MSSTLTEPPSLAAKVPENTYERALGKLKDSAYRFSKDKDGLWLQSFEGSSISKRTFIDQLKIGINCKLTEEELTSLMIQHFEASGAIDGTKFSKFFYRLRFDYKSQLKSDLLAYNRKFLESKKLEAAVLQAEADSKNMGTKLDLNFSEDDKKKAFDKIREAAFKYDRLMPGTVQLDAFDIASMTPFNFKDQLLKVFKIYVNPKELGALVVHFDKDSIGEISCADFLISFFRMGFDEKSRRLKEGRAVLQAAKDERMKKAKEEKAILEKKNSLKVSYLFTKADKDSAIKKLRDAARLNDTSAGSMKAFETAYMEPHVFKEQLKRVFNLKITAPELGALMRVFDIDGDGTISCSEFSKIFCSMGHAEREREIKDTKEKQRQEDERRKVLQDQKEKSLAMKNAQKLSYEFNDESFQSALAKLTEAAWAFDKNGTGAPNLSAFEGKEMEPHVFKEQLKRAFNMNLTPPELGALMAIFDPDRKGIVTCHSFLNKFLKVGMGERTRRRQQWRDSEIEQEKQRIAAEEKKKKEDDEKLFIEVEKNFKKEDFESAMVKLTDAACKYFKGSPGAVALTAFETVYMYPHVFKEQLKLVFNIKVTIAEMSAMLTFFGDAEKLHCRDFIIKFVRMGIKERTRQRLAWREDERAKKEKALKEEELALEKNGVRGAVEIDFHFLEEHFDSALDKLITVCHQFDSRTAGPGFKKIFEVSSLSPGEFKETLKRTFDIRTNPHELGVLVSYFDLTMSGVVSTAAFMSSFMKMRIRLEDFKGLPNEKQLIKDYHETLKEGYKKRIARLTSTSSDKDKEPWRINAPHSAFQRTGHKPYPKNAAHKLRRRLNVGLKTCKLDLSTQSKWSDMDAEAATLNIESESIKGNCDEVIQLTHEGQKDAVTDEMKSEVKGLLRKPGGIDLSAQKKSLQQQRFLEDCEYLSKYIAYSCSQLSTDKVRLTVNLATENKKYDEKIDDYLNNKLIKIISFKLAAIPPDVFNMLSLRELWLDGNELGIIPSQISELKLLEVLSISKNCLETIPPEVCLIGSLKALYVQRNNLKVLPEMFGRLQNLYTLNISANKFKSFPDVLCNLINLVNLDAEQNMIECLPMSLHNMRSLSRLNLLNNNIMSPEPVLEKMWWCEVLPACAVMITDKSATIFKISLEESIKLETFFKQKAEKLKERNAEAKKYPGGIVPAKPKKVYPKIMLR